MENKYNSLIENSTWEVVNLLNAANVIIDQWVFKLKKDRFDNILKYKTCWIAYGYKQKNSFDYINTFTAIVKSMSYKCLMVVEVKRKFRI